MKTSSASKNVSSRRNKIVALAVALVVATGGYALVVSRASGFFASISPASATLAGNAKIVTEADGSKVVQFTAPVVTPPPTPPPTTPPPPGTGTQSCPAYPAFPDASCTGSKPRDQLIERNGDITLSTPGMVYQNYYVGGTIYVTASNVTIRNVQAVNGIQIRGWEGVKNLVIEDSTIGSGLAVSHGDDGIAFSDYTCRRCDISGFSDGAKVNGNVLIEDSWVHGLYQKIGDHNDGLQNYDGSGNVTIRHSNIDVRPTRFDDPDAVGDKGNAAIFFADNPTGTMIVENSLLAGGQYTLQFLDSDKYTVIARGNHFVRNSYSLGTHRLHPNGNNVTWENNVYSDNRQVIPE